ELADALLDELEDLDLGCVLAEPTSLLLGRAAARGWCTAREGYCDRRYRDDGSLLDRSEEGAVVADRTAVVAQAIELASAGRYESLCVHGDTPGALALARAVRDGLAANGISLGSFT
ncbi:MAG: LamB/YcsF family protein, partial [Acidimicrobiales bacterium]